MVQRNTKPNNNRMGGRKVQYKRRQRVFSQAKIGYIDYKDVDLLNRFMSDRAKIRSRRVTGNTIQQQRTVVRAIKNAREMALLSYNNRIASQRILRPSYGGYRGMDSEYEEAREAEAYADLTAQGLTNDGYRNFTRDSDRPPRDGSPRDNSPRDRSYRSPRDASPRDAGRPQSSSPQNNWTGAEDVTK